MKARLGDDFYFEFLGHEDVRGRLTQCRDLTALLTGVSCALQGAERELQEKKPRAAALNALLDQAATAAGFVKKKFWKPEDRGAYAVEAGSLKLKGRVRKAAEGPEKVIPDKAVGAIKKSVAALKEKLKAVVNDRAPYWCDLRRFETVGKRPAK